MRARRRWAALALILVAAGCGGRDLTRHAPYYRQEPRTILVLPVRNQTTDAEAPRFFLSTIGQPLIERGYYVMPPHLVAEAIAAEGIDLGGESWEIPPWLPPKVCSCSPRGRRARPRGASGPSAAAAPPPQAWPKAGA